MSVEGVKDRKVVERRWARARPSGAYQPVGGTGLLLEGNGSNWGSFASTGHLAMLGDILGSHNLQKVGRGVLLAYSRMRPRMLLNIVQCPGQSPRQRMSQSQMLIVPRLREPGPKAGGGQQRVQSKAMIQAELRGENGAQGVRVEAASLGRGTAPVQRSGAPGPGCCPPGRREGIGLGMHCIKVSHGRTCFGNAGYSNRTAV